MIDRRAGPAHRVGAERSYAQGLLAHSRVKETSCGSEAGTTGSGHEQPKRCLAPSREAARTGPTREGFYRGVSLDRTGEGRGLAKFCWCTRFPSPAILVLFDDVHGDAGALPGPVQT